MAANARVHASILDLYDNARIAQPTKDNMPISWFGFEYETKSKLEEISKSSKEIVLLTQTLASPSSLKLINDLNKSTYGNVAEWLRRGLQILLFQFDSGRGLHKTSCFFF